MANRYNRFDNGSPAQQALTSDNVVVGRSAHDFSFSHAGNTLPGILAPVDCFDVVPNEDLDINITAYLEFRNPAKRQLMNGFRVYFHTRYNRLEDLWEGAKNWLDKGRSGEISLTRPTLLWSKTFNGVTANANTPLSLLNFLGLPPETIQDKVSAQVSGVATKVNASKLRSFRPSINGAVHFEASTIGNATDYFPADVCMAYQRNWRDFYCNKNLLQNNKYWFPDNEDHFILSYNCSSAMAIIYEREHFENYEVSGVSKTDEYQYLNLVGADKNGLEPDYNSITPECNNPSTNVQSPTPWMAPNLAAIKFVQFRGDRFTTSCPFPDLIRGNIPLLQITEQTVANVKGSNTTFNEISFIGDSSSGYVVRQSSNGDVIGRNQADPSKTTNFQVSIPASSITMSDIYTLETLTAFKRKMGMTNGDYNEMIKSQYGVDPHSHDRTAHYIGGFYTDFAMQTITQTSESSVSAPLGTKSSSGICAGSGSIGHFHTPDFGWISTYMFIVPDVYYTQGKPRMFSKKSNLEMYFPIFNNLPAQAIRNDELYISGNSTTDGQPFAYEDRYAEYKARQNRVSGFMGLSHSVAVFDSARIMSRRFESTPSLNSLFVTLVPENVDMEVFSVIDEPPFDFNVGVQVRRVFPGPYAAVEGSLSSPRLNAV